MSSVITTCCWRLTLGEAYTHCASHLNGSFWYRCRVLGLAIGAMLTNALVVKACSLSVKLHEGGFYVQVPCR